MVLKLWLMCVINMEVRLKKFLNDIEVQSVKYSNILGTDCYLIYTCKNYHINYLRKQLGSMDFYRVPKLQGKNMFKRFRIDDYLLEDTVENKFYRKDQGYVHIANVLYEQMQKILED